MLESDPTFASIKGDKVSYSENVLYKPAAFDKATMADQLWMVRKILKLSAEDIMEIAKESRLPLFVQEQYVSKLISRRNNLSDVYGIGTKISMPAETHASYDLSTRDARLQAVRDLDLASTFGSEDAAVIEIEKLMAKGGLKLVNGNVKYVDQVYSVANGVATGTDCSKSVIVSLLETHVYPVGFNRHQPRRKDDKPLPLCVPSGLKAQK